MDTNLTVFLINLGGGGRSAIQIVSGVDAVTAGGGGGGSDCQRTASCGGGGSARMNCLLCCLLFPLWYFLYFFLICWIGAGGAQGFNAANLANGRGATGKNGQSKKTFSSSHRSLERALPVVSFNPSSKRRYNRWRARSRPLLQWHGRHKVSRYALNLCYLEFADFLSAHPCVLEAIGAIEIVRALSEPLLLLGS